MRILDVARSTAFTLLAFGCSSPVPATSSSSHWVTCGSVGDCSALPAAKACTGGYCVDSAGERISQPSTSDSSTSDSCDPLAAHELPVKLGTILGVGQDADGVTYLADELTSPSTLDRVFVSQGKSLFRRRITGSGSSGTSDFTFSFEDDAGMRALIIHRENGKATEMALGPGGKGFIGSPGTTPLTVVDDGVVSDFTLRNLPGEVTIEYVADVDDGRVMVVTHPRDDYTYDDFRMFYGQPPNLPERHVVNTIRSRSGGTTMIFEVGGATFTASFVFALPTPSPDGGIGAGHPDPGTLDAAGKTQTFTLRWPTPTALTDLSFTCL